MSCMSFDIFYGQQLSFLFILVCNFCYQKQCLSSIIFRDLIPFDYFHTLKLIYVLFFFFFFFGGGVDIRSVKSGNTYT